MPVTYSSANAITDAPGATYDALRVRFKDLAKAVDAIGAERKAIFDEMRRREKEAAIKIRLGALKADDKAMYREVLR